MHWQGAVALKAEIIVERHTGQYVCINHLLILLFYFMHQSSVAAKDIVTYTVKIHFM